LYVGKHEPQPEPEPLDLPEDLQLDDAERRDEVDEEGQGENPFDIDKMKGE
jgi:midasin